MKDDLNCTPALID